MKRLVISMIAVLIGTTLFAQGFYLEFKISSADAKQNFSGEMKAYAQDGNSRAEVKMNIPGMAAINISTLSLSKQPDVIYLLDTKNKTYSEVSTNTEDYKDHPLSDYDVTVIGKEKVNGYKTTHVKVKVKS